MAQFELIMPKMGESIMEATILKWHKKEGEKINLDETILEIATDKVDSEIPSPVEGIVKKILFAENDVVEIGKVIALIETGAADQAVPTDQPSESSPVSSAQPSVTTITEQPAQSAERQEGNRFYSPLVKNIAKEENISVLELDKIDGTGQNGRVTKNDLMDYIASRGKTQPTAEPVQVKPVDNQPAEPKKSATSSAPVVSVSGNTEIVEMDRMRKLIADHMVMSKHTSPHVTSFVEADVTNLVQWREKVKKTYETKYGEKITFTPIFVQAVAKAIRDFPMINVSVDGTRIIVKKDINIGMATALPSGNLIVPVIKGADFLSLPGIAKTVNDLAGRARVNQLKPDEIQGGTFTLTNVGTFGNVMGTPIINQPQVAILAVGAIRKKPAVLETEYGDVIAVRQMMFLSLSYDHRVVDGSLGGSFLRKVADYLEQFDHNQQP